MFADRFRLPESGRSRQTAVGRTRPAASVRLAMAMANVRAGIANPGWLQENSDVVEVFSDW
jgi:hypothetical protein